MLNRIQQLLDERGITPSKMHEDLGFANSAMTMWIKRNSKPSADAIVKIADYFNVTTDYLLTGKERNSENVLSPDEAKLIEQYQLMNDQGKEYILQTIDMAKDRYKKSDNVSCVETEQVG